MLTAEDLIELVSAYFILNGDLITFQRGAHVNLGRVNDRGVFEITPEGEALVATLEAEPAVEVEPAPPAEADHVEPEIEPAVEVEADHVGGEADAPHADDAAALHDLLS